MGKLKTSAAVLYKIGEPLVVETLDLPELKEGQVLVEFLYSGICHSQINEIYGLKGKDNYLPHLLGHEGSGIVNAVSSGVTKVKKGDYVVVSWIKGYGKDVQGCAYDNGKVNAGAITTFNTHAVVSENRVFKIPSNVPPDVAALLGCAIPTGAGIIKNEMRLHKGNSLAIFGMGGIGSSALLYASAVGANPIIAVDISNYKLDFAKEMGATIIINGSQKDAVQEIKRLTHGKGVDFALESSGARTAMEAAIASVHDNGMAIIAGNLKKGETITIDPFDLIKGKHIRGTWGGATKPDKDILYYAKKYLNRSLPIEKLITTVYSLHEINDAVAALKSGSVVRALIKLKK